ncbi:FAD dependent oxidoreductase-domain-containing protein [Aspergillus unguis]
MSQQSIPPVKESPSDNAKHPARYGFPKEGKYSLSYWLEGVQGDPLLNHRTTSEVPSAADIVIIGSGMSGTLIANHLLETWPDKSIVILEAREFCSGATGRNAGHCKPDQWRGFTAYEQSFGTEQALKILENEQQTWSALVEYVKENNVECDLWVGDTLDVPVTPEVADIAKSTFERFKNAGGRVDHIKVTHDPAEARQISRIKDAQACYAWPASTLYPWKLTAHIMRDNIKKGVNFQTRTKATQIIKSSSHWIVKTERGDISCSQVVHATNAYSSALEPSLRGLIYPCPHMCNRVIPPIAFEDGKGLVNSYGVLLPEGGLFSVNPRSTAEGSILFGGSNPGQPEFLRWVDAHPERGTDDGLEEFPAVTQAVKEFAENGIVGWKAAFRNSGWSGIIGRSADDVPWIGALPGLSGQWICAGHNGHGMARIFTAAPGLVKLMNGRSWAETQLPEVYQITAERVARLKEQFGGNDDGGDKSRL